MAFGDGLYFEAKKVAADKPKAVEHRTEKGPVRPAFYDGDNPFEERIQRCFYTTDYTDEFVLDLEMEAFWQAMRRDRLKSGPYVLSKVSRRHWEKAKSLGAYIDRETGKICIKIPPFCGVDKRLRYFCF